MRVRIKKARHAKMWYKKHVGKTVVVDGITETDFVLTNASAQKLGLASVGVYFIEIDDAEIIGKVSNGTKWALLEAKLYKMVPRRVDMYALMNLIKKHTSIK